MRATDISLGVKIIRPVNSAVRLLVITAAAAISLILLMFGLSFGHTKSERFSNAVFSNSQTNTNPIEKMMASHSYVLIRST